MTPKELNVTFASYLLVDDLLSSPMTPLVETKDKKPLTFNRNHFWEVRGLNGVTLDTCASMLIAKNFAVSRYYWEIWEIRGSSRFLVESSATPTFKSTPTISRGKVK